MFLLTFSQRAFKFNIEKKFALFNWNIVFNKMKESHYGYLNY